MTESPKHEALLVLHSPDCAMIEFTARKAQALDDMVYHLDFLLVELLILSLILSDTDSNITGPSFKKFEWTNFRYCVVRHCMDMW